MVVNIKEMLCDNSLIYKYRSMDSLLKFEELEKNYIHFSPFSELNDPLDGYINIEFEGDKILWTNFFKNYIFSFFAFYGYVKINIEYNFIKRMPKEFEENFLINTGFIHDVIEKQDDLKKQCYKLLNSNLVQTIIEDLEARVDPIYYDELYEYLTKIHDCIVKNDAIAIPKEDKRAYFKSSQSVESVKLIQAHMIRSSINGIDLMSSYYFFPKHYMDNLGQLMYEIPYVSSFSKDPLSLPMWGYYANSSKGVCLIFKTTKNDNNVDVLYLSESPKSVLNGRPVNKEAYHFTKVDYKDSLSKISFFKFLGTRPRKEVIDYWYKFNEIVSPKVYDIYKDLKQYRKDYWEKWDNIINTKIKDWEHEKEYRIFKVDTISDYTYNNKRLNDSVIKENRRLYYDIDSLDGVIFGINTSGEDMNKIISMLVKKMKLSKTKSELNIFVVKYVGSSGKIDLKQLGFIDNSSFHPV